MDKSPSVGGRVRLDPDVLTRAITDLPARGHRGQTNATANSSSSSSSLVAVRHAPRAHTLVSLTTAAGGTAGPGPGPKPGPGKTAGRDTGTTTVRFTLRMKTPKKARQKRPLTPTESVSDGYFSDSDDEDKRKRRSPVTGRTSTDFMLDTCVTVYESSCKRLKIIPRQHFLKQLGNKLMSMRNEGLTRKELNAVCASLVNFEKLFSVDFSGNLLTDRRGPSYICQLLERNSFITDLTLSECEINLDGLRDIVAVVPKISTLQKLDISGNKFKDDAGELLSILITKAQDLTHLSLRHNELREAGGVYIGDAIAKNEGLETLDLSWNHLRGKGAECVALALLANKTLTHLDVSWNGFGFEGCCALGHSLHNNTTLKEINLTCNRIHPGALYELLKGTLCNRGLTCLRLGQNPIPATMTSAILAKFRDATEMPLVTLDFTGIVVDKLFEVVLDEIHEARPYFECLYDRSLPVHKNRWQDLDKLHKGVLNIDPMRILFFIKKNLRIIDLFRQMDTDHSATITRDEIRKALLKQELPVSSASLDAIMDYLDTNKDGEVDLMELSDGERRFKRKTISEKQEWQARERMSIEQSQKSGLPADLGGSGARFSRSFRPDLNDLQLQSREKLGSTLSTKPKANFLSDDFKLPNINERPGNITENQGASNTERGGQRKADTSADPLPNTVR